VVRHDGGATTVIVRVLRDACCAQDDQLGPLETTYDVRPDATLRDFVTSVADSGFLQYSASHTSMLGFIDGKEFVRVFSPYY
jgi:hypothetical protein